MDFNITLDDFGQVAVQELWNKVAFGAMELVKESEDVAFEKESFKEFSKHIAELNILFRALEDKRVEATTSSKPTRDALETLYSQLTKASKIIKDYKSGSKLRLVLNSHSELKQMKEITKEIAETISLLELSNLDTALDLKSKTDDIINNLRSIEFRSAASTEAIASEIEKSMNQNERNREHTVELLHKIGEVVGERANSSLVRKELALLKQEKEDMEEQKKASEAFQLSQLIQLLHSTEMVSSPRQEEIPTYPQSSIASFTCPLCHQLMTDPVAIVCGHSFERKAIQAYFIRGEITCPTCEQELSSMELTPNISLRSSIEEWKQRDMYLKFQSAISGITTSNDHDILSKALDDLQILMEVTQYRVLVSEKEIIPRTVKVLKDNGPNTTAALKCLYQLSCFSDDNKEAIVKEGAIRYIVKHLYRVEAESNAVAILLELSTKETLAEKIGNAKDCIPLLASLMRNNKPNISSKAQEVLHNLSWNTHYVIKMAEAGYFQPFISRFNEVSTGSSETRASMAAALVEMQLGDNNIKDLKHEQFIHNLVNMLSSSSPFCKTACLKCIKKLLVYREMVKKFLDTNTIPLLIGLISFVQSEELWKQEATEILISLIETTELSDFQTHPDLQELQSQHNVRHFLRLAATSDPRIKPLFLNLLLVLSHKSKIARNLVRSDEVAVANLFSSLNEDQPKVRQQAMKLIYCISEDHPSRVPLPESPAKENAVNSLVSILTSSTDIKERSSAAAIISRLPSDDIIVDEILLKSEALKAIQEVIRATDDEHHGIKAFIDPGESLLENALAALLLYTQPTKPELQRQVGKLELYPSLVRILSRGSSLAKQRTAIALAHLSQSSNMSIKDVTIVSNQENNSFSLLQLSRLFSNMSWCCSPTARHKNLCSIHGSACSSRYTFCLVKADAVRPLLQTLSDTQSGAAEAALIALNTLVKDHSTLSHAATAIVDSQGVTAILEVLERGTLSTKDKALDLFQTILQNTTITRQHSQRSERILIQLLAEDALKKKAALVLRQMDLLPEQSSYF